MLQTADIDAPTLMGVMVLLLLYADDLILISESASGLEKQLDALASFCVQRQLTVNLSKTKVVVFESDMCDFVVSGAAVERVESYKCLGFFVHATKKLTLGTDALVAMAKMALFAMRRQCALLRIQDPALQCTLFDTLVSPILSYGCEVWGVDTKRGAAAEALHRDFLRHLFGVRKSTANYMVLAELGRFPLQIHFWQQCLRYHHGTIAFDSVRLVKLALVDDFALDQTAVKDSWQHYLGVFLHSHLGQQQLFNNVDIAGFRGCRMG